MLATLATVFVTMSTERHHHNKQRLSCFEVQYLTGCHRSDKTNLNFICRLRTLLAHPTAKVVPLENENLNNIKWIIQKILYWYTFSLPILAVRRLKCLWFWFKFNSTTVKVMLQINQNTVFNYKIIVSIIFVIYLHFYVTKGHVQRPSYI